MARWMAAVLHTVSPVIHRKNAVQRASNTCIVRSIEAFQADCHRVCVPICQLDSTGSTFDPIGDIFWLVEVIAELVANIPAVDKVGVRCSETTADTEAAYVVIDPEIIFEP